MAYEITGWASDVLEPITIISGAFSISWMEFVIAPAPSVEARPATVGACQVRAQWSTLFVPMTARINFIIT